MRAGAGAGAGPAFRGAARVPDMGCSLVRSSLRVTGLETSCICSGIGIAMACSSSTSHAAAEIPAARVWKSQRVLAGAGRHRAL
jgi:hypothetical protein